MVVDHQRRSLRTRLPSGIPGLPQPLSEINVTPLVDVMLVLLVIFMITAPLIARGVNVDLPSADGAELASDRKPIEIAIDGTGQIYVGESPVTAAAFVPLLDAIARAEGHPDQLRVFVSADRSLDYGAVMRVVAQVSHAGFTRVALVSEGKARSGETPAP